MVKSFKKPKIVISRCIEFDNCRYNSQIIRSDFVKKLKPHIDFITVCPEVEVGLGIPRLPVRVVLKNKAKKLIQPETSKDLTSKMNTFSKNFLINLENVDGFILKSRSPSCGINDVKIYPSSEKSAPIYRESGVFGENVLKLFPSIAIEDEARLRNTIIREHFLRKIYTTSSFKEILKSKDINELIKFHSQNKFLLMSYGQKYLKKLGQIVAKNKKVSLKDLLNEYEQNLYSAFKRGPRCTNNINVLNHTFGFVSEKLNSDEKKMFIDSINDFREGRIPLSVPLNLMKSWILRFDVDYLHNQTFFEPYPIDLLDANAISICSSREYWE
jgi:uncharacterized protein YbgA (DUF1722 family)/uncharacterized protein YbbK (DUF523 family)